jgi:hypothetical protein
MTCERAQSYRSDATPDSICTKSDELLNRERQAEGAGRGKRLPTVSMGKIMSPFDIHRN